MEFSSDFRFQTANESEKVNAGIPLAFVNDTEIRLYLSHVWFGSIWRCKLIYCCLLVIFSLSLPLADVFCLVL